MKSRGEDDQHRKVLVSARLVRVLMEKALIGMGPASVDATFKDCLGYVSATADEEELTAEFKRRAEFAKVGDDLLDRWKERYPLLEFRREKDGGVTVLSKNSRFTVYTGAGELRAEAEHARRMVEKRVMDMFPNLKVLWPNGPSPLDGAITVHLWTSGGVGMGELDLLRQDAMERLRVMDEESKLASRDGWMYCTGHSRAEPTADGRYGWFSGTYCKEYGDRNPEHRLEASRENYE